MSLKHATANPQALLRRLKIQPLEPVNLQKAIRAIPWDADAAPRTLDIAALQEMFAEIVTAEKLKTVSNADMKQAPYGFFDGPLPFVSDAHVSHQILGEMNRRAHKSSVRLLAFQYIEYFDAQRPGFTSVAKWLDAEVRRWEWSWRQRAEKFDLFQPDRVAANLATHILSGDSIIEERAYEAGLSTQSLAGGLGSAAFAAACDIVSQQKTATVENAQKRLMEWGRRSDTFIYPSQASGLVSALLLPWATQDPSATHKKTLLSLLETMGGDPRVSPARWNRIKAEAPQAFALLLKWLTKASVYQFFDIIDDLIPRDERHMWAYRRPFWTAYLEAGHIDEAWVVFGTSGIDRARDLAGRLGIKAASGFGSLKRAARGKTNDHAALVMKIGDLMVAEWSHSGAYQVWPVTDRHAPKLYRSAYDVDDLMDAPFSAPHAGSDGYSWQSKLSEYIRRETGRKTNTQDWKPRR